MQLCSYAEKNLECTEVLYASIESSSIAIDVAIANYFEMMAHKCNFKDRWMKPIANTREHR